MDKVYKIETLVSETLAELYEIIVEQFDKSSSIPLSEVNRALLQTGMMHQLEMMLGLGLISDIERRKKVEHLIEDISKDTIHWELLQLARRHWRNSGGFGQMGTLDLEA